FVVGTGFILIFLTLTVDERISSKLENPIKDIHQLQVDVAKMNAKLDTFIDLEREQIKKIGQLRPVDFERSLPSVDASIKVASAFMVPSPPETLNALRHNFLVANNSLPGYWEGLSAFLTY